MLSQKTKNCETFYETLMTSQPDCTFSDTKMEEGSQHCFTFSAYTASLVMKRGCILSDRTPCFSSEKGSNELNHGKLITNELLANIKSYSNRRILPDIRTDFAAQSSLCCRSTTRLTRPVLICGKPSVVCTVL